uniref:Uncharacterized protein n=1 Tax=Anopheles farauti TaxID=69004 RepID=A0A182QAJ7_9DIPT
MPILALKHRRRDRIETHRTLECGHDRLHASGQALQVDRHRTTAQRLGIAARLHAGTPQQQRYDVRLRSHHTGHLRDPHPKDIFVVDLRQEETSGRYSLKTPVMATLQMVEDAIDCVLHLPVNVFLEVRHAHIVERDVVELMEIVDRLLMLLMLMMMVLLLLRLMMLMKVMVILERGSCSHRHHVWRDMERILVCYRAGRMMVLSVHRIAYRRSTANHFIINRVMMVGVVISRSIQA